ncbi:hypothetical protein L211DRAFT_510018 [Terfezia boudieri ATCC MYA-4762]|uniref:Secreted protein n=1 Tax=Terfezia boudieri ATCC MYA-4762 TaxID=1051890 RepID=A0A3N4LGJ9_9PEZI|nr:hypothetical protein L211DRAFT_510018 [Terfezia boudieri ATCC MYA-4762]
MFYQLVFIPCSFSLPTSGWLCLACGVRRYLRNLDESTFICWPRTSTSVCGVKYVSPLYSSSHSVVNQAQQLTESQWDTNAKSMTISQERMGIYPSLIQIRRGCLC